jgi:hypothetical protein
VLLEGRDGSILGQWKADRVVVVASRRQVEDHSPLALEGVVVDAYFLSPIRWPQLDAPQVNLKALETALVHDHNLTSLALVAGGKLGKSQVLPKPAICRERDPVSVGLSQVDWDAIGFLMVEGGHHALAR